MVLRSFHVRGTIHLYRALYTLSDDQTEYQLCDRLSFMRFVGLGLHNPFPDAKTIWLFREQLTRVERQNDALSTPHRCRLAMAGP